jgi:SAM-dependent methyltransferase
VTDIDAEGVSSNRDLWNAWTPHHVESEFYDVEGFVADPASQPFDPIVRAVIGDVSGLRLLHLQCHFGLDTLRLALAGAHVTGIDFSHEAIVAARVLAERTGLPAVFVESDVRALPDEVPVASFDVVYTSHGVLSWLPDLRPWAATIARSLAPGGVFHVIDGHPTPWIFDDETLEPPLRVRYPYFGHDALVFEERGSYAVPDADVTTVSYSWPHTFEEIVGSLLAEGLVIESLREYPKTTWRMLPWMVRGDDGFWRLPPEFPEIPLMFSLSARRRG